MPGKFFFEKIVNVFNKFYSSRAQFSVFPFTLTDHEPLDIRNEIKIIRSFAFRKFRH